MKRDSGYWMDVACFNVVDNGKLKPLPRSPGRM